VSLAEGDTIELKVTPDPYVTVRYAGASGDFNPIHIDEAFAQQVARAHTEAGGGPETLRRLSVQFRGMGRLDEEIEVKGTVREVQDGIAVIDSEAVQGGQRIVRNAVAEVRVG
jgi:hypothetical protein